MKNVLAPLILVVFLLSLLLSCTPSAYSPSTRTSPNSLLPTDCPTSTPTPAGTITPQPTRTETPWPTLRFSIDPCFKQSMLNKSFKTYTPAPTITAPPSRTPQLVLPGHLQIEEYQLRKSEIYKIESQTRIRHNDEMGGWWFWPKGGKINGKQFQATETNNGISASIGEHQVFEVDCRPVTPIPYLITAWVFDDHWIIQSVCHRVFDIFFDGKSLNASEGYQSSFAFQILGGRPFYLFKKNDKVWLHYENSEVLLGYDEVMLTYCCDTYHPPQHYENMIMFYSKKGEQLYYVIIGLLK